MDLPQAIIPFLDARPSGLVYGESSTVEKCASRFTTWTLFRGMVCLLDKWLPDNTMQSIAGGRAVKLIEGHIDL
jgi:hypothetical protein